MAECYAVISGWYSDYSVDCVFQNEDDAKAYATRSNVSQMRREHDIYTSGTQFSRSHNTKGHKGNFETCIACKTALEHEGEADLDYRVERFDYWETGELKLPDSPEQTF